MNGKIDTLLHAKIRELFPLEMGKSVIIEILTLEPLSYQSTTYSVLDEVSKHVLNLAKDRKSYFVVDSLSREMPVFVYKDAFITLEKEYLTHKTIRYSSRQSHDGSDRDKLSSELNQLSTLLKSKAS